MNDENGGRERRGARTDREIVDMLMKQNEVLRQAVLALEGDKARAESRLQSVPPLLEEVDRLRSALSAMEVEKRMLEQHAAGLRDELDRRTIEHDRLQRELASALGTGQRLLAQYTEAEQHNNNLAHLYVTASRLHGTCNREEVLRAIREVISFFIGCEQAAVFELDEDGEYLKLISAWGVDRELYWRIPVGRGLIGRAALGGEIYVRREENAEGEGRADEDELTACVPLKLEGRVFGAIALFRLAAAKGGQLTAPDHELLNLLATHAATALYCTGLHERLHRDPQETEA